MDQIDHAILNQLRADGRLANNELAERVGLSPSPCLRRVRALEEAGVITGYHANIEPKELGKGLHVLLHVELAEQRGETVEAFEAAVQELEEVVACQRMFGSPDYLLHLAVRDIEDYEQAYMAKLTQLPGIARTTSQFTMKTVKSTPGFPY
ncbi:Lrp/AsnC family transcriptional regulator [Sciscionella marina]|uniref:Lrp/AsnC family transcriptional regulator n=1 Tax=Sciscionella marina TaxID=508770 RepID=UPI000371DB71|nr:Lrp/AsnC family transcriptional regulator [Sciscionella marina]